MKDQSTQNRAYGCEIQHSEKEVVLKEYFQEAIIHTLCYHRNTVNQCRKPTTTHKQVKEASHKNTKLIKQKSLRINNRQISDQRLNTL